MFNRYYTNDAEMINYNHTVTDGSLDMGFHLHNAFEIYFFISGNVNYFIENKVYTLKYGDLFIMNNHEIHKLSLTQGKPYERIVIHFDPELVQQFNSSQTNLLDCFIQRPKGEQNKINLTHPQLDKLTYMLQRMELNEKHLEPHTKVLKLLYLIELLVFLNQAFSAHLAEDNVSVLPCALIPIVEYIEMHLDRDLSLDFLGNKFFINKYHLVRLFKKHTGSNLHQYIIIKRISLAKKLLSEGMSVTDACLLCGFNDYSHFLRIFKKKVGSTPGQYLKYLKRNT